MFNLSRQEQYIIILLLLAIFSGSGIVIYRNSGGQVITVLDPVETPQEEMDDNGITSVEPVIDASPKIYVHVSGEVVNPGVYELEEGSRVHAAIELAGGVTQDADVNVLNLAQLLHDAQKVYVPAKGSEPQILTDTSGLSPGAITDEYVNINSASKGELETLPGIGSVLAERIVEYRRVHGRFVSKEELMKVPGIGEKKFAEIEDLVVVN